MADTTPEPETIEENETLKEKMRQALERKNQRAHRANQARQNTGTIHGSQVNGAGKRTFRRKSG
ncbi:DUF5302 domain-containing protein [Georgenia sp. TF02-10]|uniref:DUF5302 domain-containing protein n=1 Tax=Georgenia sp. TF02-10 TaxID=2917725 RepID=UPI001FA76833|nr:DUF5302 domain-containing protein [Georgenia sp. TF02-10]UNX55777.1 DUF5302 domain-containing protein [Georgenia sp. TF02-10]